ncbi:hypothetical protein FDP22_07045 [Paroceanicella profunda]|uniref:Sulfotransferase family protein n=1 Tax=Paroceanicella profunda TaxID=2579971 RepID=A0A5B8FGR8_9RHOB|nr:sulfotransferase family 2 domain-containing protein [Paroceanicella profunda]QDL91561.1 hypothetical protein FDP22_07045 [Paroceanicella profunda]
MSFSDLKRGHVVQYIEDHKTETGLWFLHHIPKTAGSSLAQELATRLRPYRNMAIDYQPDTSFTGDMMSAAVTQFIESGMALKCRSASGHVFAPHIRQIARAVPDVSFFTYLRHPVSRIVSEYRYCRTEMHPPWRNFITRYPTIDAFVDEPLEANKMSRYLFGTVTIAPEAARELLFSRYAFIGLQERYPLSYLLMSRMMWGGSAPQAKSRVTPSTAENAVEMTADLHARILANNALDISLYKAVSDVYADIASEAWDMAAA